MNNYIQNLTWRYATKKFDPSKKLSSEQLDLLLESLRLSPSSYGVQPWKFYLITNPELRSQVRAAAWDQSQVTDASHLILVASRTEVTEKDVDEYITNVSETRGVTPESLEGFKKMISGTVSGMSKDDSAGWAARQAYLAVGFLLSAAAENQIDSCPMEGFDSPKVSELVGALSEGYQVRVMCPVGFRAEDDNYIAMKKVRYPKERIIKEL